MQPSNPQYETLSTKALRLLRITTTMQSLFLFAVLGIPAYFILILVLPFYTALAIVLGAGSILSILAIWFLPPLRFRRYRYLIAADKVEIMEGLFFVSRKIIPIDRIHQIDVVRGPLDSLTGVGKVVVTTAGSQSSFRFLEPERAEQIALYLNETIQKKLKAAKEHSGGKTDV